MKISSLGARKSSSVSHSNINSRELKDLHVKKFLKIIIMSDDNIVEEFYNVELGKKLSNYVWKVISHKRKVKIWL